MALKDLFTAIDADPFEPFTIELVSGRKLPVVKPDHIFVLPSRTRVINIIVYAPDWADWALIFPAGIVGLFFGGNDTADN